MSLVSTLCPKARNCRGFSLIELVVASSLVVSFFGAAALGYRAVSVNQKRLARFGEIDIGAGNALNFYDLASSNKDVYWAPNYGTAIRADAMRDLFYDDLQHASAVYCLPRSGTNDIRPTTIALTGTYRGTEIDTPNEFIDVLDDAYASADTTFSTYRGVPAAADRNATIYILQPSSSVDELWVWSIWEIDFVSVTSPETGTYASVRRYVNSTLTRVYDTFYPVGGGTATFGPAFAHFELKNRSVLVEGASIDRFKVAPSQPFYFVWWPDPSSPILQAGADAASYSTSDPRSAYAMHEDQTSYHFVVPMFPSLQ
ncbi:MAG: prepilin-type N-terminal cleavage/methylation domain-containing protein [Verrucomicrobiales bacterium]|jgi:prepilin-type N-terminal cleavage/methylation domain-containing protein